MGYCQTHQKTWLAAVATLIAVLGLVSFFGFQDRYRSETMIAVDDKQPPSILFSSSDSKVNVQGEGLFSLNNVIRSQLEMLQSPAFLYNVYVQGKQQHVVDPSVDVPWKLTKNKWLDAEGVSQTNFIRLIARGDSPQKAQTLAETYLDAFKSFYKNYQNYNLIHHIEVLKSSLQKVQMLVVQQKNKIKDFEVKNGITGSDGELDGLLTQIGAMATDIEDTKSGIAKEATTKEKLQSHLGMNTQTAVAASMAGQDMELSQLDRKIQTLKRTYQANQKDLTDNHPTQKLLKQTIQSLEQTEAAEKTKRGQTQPVTSNKVLKNDFSWKMASDLLKADVNANALQASLANKQAWLGQLEDKLKAIPEKQGTLNGLVTELEILEEDMSSLRSAYEEFQLRLQYDQVAVLTPPTLPGDRESHLYQRLLLTVLLALLLPTLWFVLKFNLLRTRNVNTEFLQKVLHVPVLASIDLEGQYPSQPGNTLAFERAVRQTCYLLQQQKDHLANPVLLCLPVSSSTNNAFGDRAFIQQLAGQLTRSGDKVLVLNFLKPLPKSDVPDAMMLNEAVFSVEEVLRQNFSSQAFLQLVAVEEQGSKWPLSQLIQQITDSDLERWLYQLRQQYQWIFMILPPMPQEPGNLVLLPKAQGVLLDVDPSASHQTVEAACIQINQTGSRVLGAVVEEL